MSTLSPTRNSWMLDRKPEVVTDQQWIIEMGVQQNAPLQIAPVYRQLDKEFWNKHFNSFKFAELQSKCAALGIEPGRTKLLCVRALTQYFRNLLS